MEAVLYSTFPKEIILKRQVNDEFEPLTVVNKNERCA